MSQPFAPSAPPDLVPLGVSIQFHPDGSAFDLRYLITNAGGAPARGGFQIGLSAHYRDHSQDPAEDVTISDTVTFPPNVFIEPGDTVPSGYLRNLPFRPNKLDPEYPLVHYDFECDVDVEHQVAESDTQNNNVQTSMNVGLPRIIRPPVGPIQQ